MHIVFVTTELATSNNSSGGLASYTANMARIFRKHGHDVTIVLATTSKEVLEFDSGIELNVSYIEINKWEKMDKAAGVLEHICKESKDEIRKLFVNLHKSKQVRKIVSQINKRKKIDIVHYCNLGAVAMWADKRIPYCVRLSSFVNMCRGADTPNGNIGYDENKLTIKEKLTDYVVSKTKYVISPSNLLAKVSEENLNVKAKVLESPYLMDNQQWNYITYDKLEMKSKKYVIYYGSLKYLKGIQVIADLIYELLSRYSDIHMVLIGNSANVIDRSGNIVKAHELIIMNAGEYSDRVIYIGALSREQLYPFIQNAEVCLLPSRIENLSNACIEAMAMGKIVIATNGASYEQLIDDRISGFLCERDNPDSFLKALEEALTMSVEEKTIISQNAITVTKRLSPDNIYEKYLEYYQKVIREWGTW